MLKTDNRPAPIRTSDLGKIEIATWGADYAHVFNTTNAGKFDFLVWGVVQTGSWGNLEQRAGSFVGEAGWQPPVKMLKPWISAGYSYGSGDGNPNDSRHGTFFQVLPTPRQYARFPFYNMMNNEDLYGTAESASSFKAGTSQRSAYPAAGECLRFLVLRRRAPFSPRPLDLRDALAAATAAWVMCGMPAPTTRLQGRLPLLSITAMPGERA